MTNKKLIQNALLLAAYFTYLLFLIRVSNQEINQLIVLFGLAPFSVPLLIKYSLFSKRRKYFLKIAGLVALFFLCYSLISTYNIKVLARGFCYFFIFLSHISIIIWFTNKKEFLDVRVTILALLLISIFVIFIPHYAVVGSLKLGAFYNLVDPSLLTQTTLEAPLIVAILCLLSIFNYIFNKDRSFLSFFSILFSVFVLLVFNRRGFIFSSFISVTIYYFYTKTQSKILLYSSLVLLFLPMFWNTISAVVVDASNTELFSAIIVRNNRDELVTATGRAIAWLDILALFFTFKSKYLFGFYGGPPTDLFLTTGEDGRFEHAHNTFLQLFLETGYFNNVVFLVMLIICIKRYASLKRINKKSHNFYMIMLIFLLSLSATESLVREIQFTTFIFCYVLIGSNVWNERTRLLNKVELLRRQADLYQEEQLNYTEP